MGAYLCLHIASGSVHGFRACRRNRRCTMRLPLLLAIAALGFAGCTSAPKSELATTDDGVDHARMVVIEQQALQPFDGLLGNTVPPAWVKYILRWLRAISTRWARRKSAPSSMSG